jgi:hypothetical protein
LTTDLPLWVVRSGLLSITFLPKSDEEEELLEPLEEVVVMI